MKPKYEIGAEVYLKTDVDQSKRIVTGFVVRPNFIIYYLGCGTNETAHYDIEISREKDYTV